jgi:hypothetical protein
VAADSGTEVALTGSMVAVLGTEVVLETVALETVASGSTVAGAVGMAGTTNDRH